MKTIRVSHTPAPHICGTGRLPLVRRQSGLTHKCNKAGLAAIAAISTHCRTRSVLPLERTNFMKIPSLFGG
eukprot:3543971-Amphidinium_carterae.2